MTDASVPWPGDAEFVDLLRRSLPIKEAWDEALLIIFCIASRTVPWWAAAKRRRGEPIAEEPEAFVVEASMRTLEYLQRRVARNREFTVTEGYVSMKITAVCSDLNNEWVDREPPVPIELIGENVQPPGDRSGSDLGKAMVSAEDRRQLQSCLRRLKKGDPEGFGALILRQVQGLSCEEAGDKVGVDAATMWRRERRALRTLRDCLRTQGWDR
jgi:DNA-directed RNA polymerase specialized sigma24 family protein